MDSPENSEDTRIDYSCLGGLVAVEIKSLEDDASERMDNLTNELRERDDWPLFLGSAPIQSFIKHLEDSKKIERKVFERVGRAIKNHIHKANNQLEAHTKSGTRKNICRIVFLVNEDHELYDPETVAFIVQKLLLRKNDGIPLYPNIDAVIFKSERHATSLEGELAFPILCVEGTAIEQALWKRDLLDLICKRWGAWNNRPTYHFDRFPFKFETIEHTPEQMKLYEKWELEYRRNPYMTDFSRENLRNRFDEIIAVSSLKFIVGSPETPVDAAVIWSMSSMSHMMLEMGWRGIPITEFPQEPDRLAEAARRLKFTDDAVQWLKNGLKDK